MDLPNATLGIALVKIVWVNLLLSGDNAVAIALAARHLAGRRQRWAVVIGSTLAIALRVVLTLFVAELLQLPWLKLGGAVLLLWIGVQLLDDDDVPGEMRDALGPWAAVRTILIADVVMSLDNVIAVAAAADAAPGPARLPLLVAGLGLSIPLIIFGSSLLLRLMEQLPVLVTLGAALLGFVAGEMAVSDPAAQAWVATDPTGWHEAAALGGAFVVVTLGLWRARRKAAGD